MTIRRKLLLASLGAAVIFASLVAAFTRRAPSEKPQPSYKYQQLSDWLAMCRPRVGPWDTGGEAELAVRLIGTNALPFLLEWIRYELPPWRQRLLTLATWPVPGKPLYEAKIVFGQSLILGESTRLAELAELGFVILNSNAIPAIPDLERLMKDKQKPVVGLRAIYALGAIGGPAMTALTNALADTKQTNRIEIMHALMGAERASPYYYGSAYQGAALPVLTQALQDPDPWIRRQASVTLYNITNVTPRLLQVLHAPPPPR
jgi:hypothetical protein